METEAILMYGSQEAALPRPQAPQHTIGRVAGNKVSEMLCFGPKHLRLDGIQVAVYGKLCRVYMIKHTA